MITDNINAIPDLKKIKIGLCHVLSKLNVYLAVGDNGIMYPLPIPYAYLYLYLPVRCSPNLNTTVKVTVYLILTYFFPRGVKE